MALPHNELRYELVSSYSSVAHTLGLLSSTRPLVLPNGEFFPDLFTGDEASVQRLLDRLLDHAGLSDMAVVARIFGEAEESCGTGACGSCGPSADEPDRVERLSDGGEFWQVNVLPSELGQPVALSSALCRAIALAVLREADSAPALPLELAVDLTAVALGFGVLLLEGSHIYRKACAGPSVSRATLLGPGELGLLLALWAAVNGQPVRKVSKHLSPTQQEAFAEAKLWADSNAPLILALQSDPERVARGEFSLRQESSWLGRWFSKKTRSEPSTLDELEAALGTAAPVCSAPKALDPKFEEIRRLVDEALSE